MVAEGETVARALDLQVAVAARQAKALSGALWMRRLNVVVR